MLEIFKNAVEIENFTLNLPNVLSTTVFGRCYKGYVLNNKCVICECEKKSIENKIKIHEKYFIKNKQKNYYDYISDEYYEYISLEDFLGLPKELGIDYSKEILSQITFIKYICHDCNSMPYEYMINGKDKKAEILRKNRLLAKGIMYVPVAQSCYFLLSELSSEDLLNLVPEFKDFNVRDKVCIYSKEINGPVMVDNPNKYQQIENIKKFLSLNTEDIVQVLYGNESHKSIADFLYNQNNIDMTYLKLDKEIPYKMSGQYLHREDIKNLTKRFRELCSKLYKQKPKTINDEYDEVYSQIIDKYINKELFDKYKKRLKIDSRFCIMPSFFCTDEKLEEFVKWRLQIGTTPFFVVNYQGFLINPIVLFVLAIKDLDLCKQFLLKIEKDYENLEQVYDYVEYLFYLKDKEQRFYEKILQMMDDLW